MFSLIVFNGSYSRREPEEPEDATKGRDVFNEKPPADELLAVSDIGKSVTSLPDNVVRFLSLMCTEGKTRNCYDLAFIHNDNNKFNNLK